MRVLQLLCVLLYGFGRARVTPTATLPPALSLCTERAADFRLRDFSDVMWSLAMMRVTDATILTAAADLISHCERLLKTQSTSAYPTTSSGCLQVYTIDDTSSNSSKFEVFVRAEKNYCCRSASGCA